MTKTERSQDVANLINNNEILRIECAEAIIDWFESDNITLDETAAKIRCYIKNHYWTVQTILDLLDKPISWSYVIVHTNKMDVWMKHTV